MARLYWRVKKNGKWTWRPAQFETIQVPYGDNGALIGRIVVKEEEE